MRRWRRSGRLWLIGVALYVSGATAAIRSSALQVDTFVFAEGRSLAVTATLHPMPDGATEVVWPEYAGSTDWDTALLAIGVATGGTAGAGGQAGPAGATSQPYLEIAAGGRTDRQYFRAGIVGPRWVNLSFLREVLSPGVRVVLRPHEMALGVGPTSLRLFESDPDLSGRILVLAPHPDDAEIGAFGLYAHRNATVVTVTAGNAGSNTYEAVFGDGEIPAAYAFKGRVRAIDSVTVPWYGGIPPERTYNLGYFDARLAEMFDRRGETVPERYGPNTDVGVYRQMNIGSLLPNESRASTWEHLVEDMERLLDEVEPDVIAAPHPQLDSHLDHQFTTVALAEAIERWDEDVTLLLYTNHADGNRYPYGPAGTLVSMPPPLGSDVLLDRIYSLPVPGEVQRLKLFALESMHDLRYTPTRQYQLALGEGRAIEPEKEGSGPDITYLRRGPRSNELFFAYDQDTVRPMIQRFLEARARQQTGGRGGSPASR